MVLGRGCLVLLTVLLGACSTNWYLDRGEDAVHAMDLVQAERAFRSALAREPDNPQALYGLGWTYHIAGHGDEAREAFERCIQVAPESELGFKGLGSIALAQGNLDVAQGRFDQALQLAPTDPSVRNSLALLHIRAERYEQALEVYSTLEAEGLLAPEGAIGQAEALLRLDRLDEALATVESALDKGAPSPRQATLLHTLRARVLHASTTGRLDDQRCAETAPALLAWLDEADRSLDMAEALELDLESLLAVRREVHQRRKLVLGRCPEQRVSAVGD